MLSRKISKSRKHSKKHFRKNTKTQKGGAFQYFYLLNNEWIKARDYQEDAINDFSTNLQKNKIFEYNKNGYKFSLRFLYHVPSNNEYLFEMIREDGSLGYLKKIEKSDFSKGFRERLTNMPF